MILAYRVASKARRWKKFATDTKQRRYTSVKFGFQHFSKDDKRKYDKIFVFPHNAEYNL